MRKRRVAGLALLFVLFAGAGAFYLFGRGIWVPLLLRYTGTRSVEQVLAKYGPGARARLAPHFARAHVAYPPKRLTLLAFKKERRVAVWADGHFIRAYPILAASGHAGPKLREGDYQVPEGLYRITGLNPNSNYHLSMRVGYPNAFDQRMAARDRRTRLGGDIMIHGNMLSIGCIAVGDTAIEELFTLVAQTGLSHTEVIIAPNDLRSGGAVMHEDAPAWTAELYRTIAAALQRFPLALESDSAIGVRGMTKTPKR
ncbi:MAG TPA: L,D-transpeptidase family protein [Thermoanaerobaculia bacterium]|nr:L,D-transpeptidase family protein [Thermoanaerobaculia bacterium]